MVRNLSLRSRINIALAALGLLGFISYVALLNAKDNAPPRAEDLRAKYATATRIPIEPGEHWKKPLEEQHPDVDRPQLANHSVNPETMARYLKNQGFEARHTGGMSFSIRKPGEAWKVIDLDPGNRSRVGDHPVVLPALPWNKADFEVPILVAGVTWLFAFFVLGAQGAWIVVLYCLRTGAEALAGGIAAGKSRRQASGETYEPEEPPG